MNPTWKITKITPMSIKNKENVKQLLNYMYTKDKRFGFTEEQDIKILKEMYPEAKDIEIIYSTKGECHFVLS